MTAKYPCTPVIESSSSIRKTLKQSCLRLSQSNKTLEDIYNIVFYREGVLCETSDARGLISYTYKDFRNATDRVASALLQEIGCGHYVALYGKNSFAWTVSMWAILKSGNKPYLINMMHPKEAIRSALETLDCVAVLCTEAPAGLGKEELLYSTLVNTEASACSASFADSIALSTSGTTLEEKICIYSGEVISNQILNAPHIIRKIPSIQDSYEGKLKMLMVLPLYHIFGLEASYLWFLFFGAIFVFPPTLAPSVLLGVIKRHKITHLFSVPLLWQEIEKNARKEIASLDEKTQEKLAKASETSIRLQHFSPALGKYFAKKAFRPIRNKLFGNSLKFCISGGAHIVPEALRFINALGYPLYNGYGMTEIGIVSANFTGDVKKRLTNSIGVPFTSVQTSTDHNGHLLIRGDSVCREMIVNGKPLTLTNWFDTGDIVTQNEDGEFEICGRASDLVISADGENLNPDVAQNALSLSCALAFCVLGNAQKDALSLIVQIPKDAKGHQLEAVKEEVAREIGSLPSAYRIRDVFYTTDSLLEANEIKISRKKLRLRIDRREVCLSDGTLREEGAAESLTEIATEIRGIFSEVLHLPPEEIGASAHFMNDLGGTSLEYYDVIYRIENRFEIKLDFQGEHFGYTLSDFEKIVKEKTVL